MTTTISHQPTAGRRAIPVLVALVLATVIAIGVIALVHDGSDGTATSGTPASSGRSAASVPHLGSADALEHHALEAGTGRRSPDATDRAATVRYEHASPDAVEHWAER